MSKIDDWRKEIYPSLLNNIKYLLSHREYKVIFELEFRRVGNTTADTKSCPASELLEILSGKVQKNKFIGFQVYIIPAKIYYMVLKNCIQFTDHKSHPLICPVFHSKRDYPQFFDIRYSQEYQVGLIIQNITSDGKVDLLSSESTGLGELIVKDRNSYYIQPNNPDYEFYFPTHWGGNIINPMGPYYNMLLSVVYQYIGCEL